ncbi:hypothetical protein [Thalassotalea sp. PS06]|uniref:hypothetical protein n=1 Tax=Thalassotalea sp. PS06 TaxID=2594005 RepID=UPI0011647691|nr:hypothetical protein [Thalassotalea sp. PS06]QDP00230.1 hypothetical protein FNC98_02005 [Thalassotalea sp. PS06]
MASSSDDGLVYADELVEFFCNATYIDTTADLANFPNLASVGFHGVGNSSIINAYDFPGIRNFALTSSKLNYLDVNNLENLVELDLQNNLLLTTVDVSNAVKLKEITISESPLEAIDLINLSELESLHLYTKFFYIDEDGNGLVSEGSLISLSLEYNEKLTEVVITGARFSSLTLKNHEALTQLIVEGDIQFVDLDLPSLITLNLESNELGNIDLSLLPNIENLNLSSNHLTEIDFSFNPSLAEVDLTNNKWTDASLEYLSNIDWIENLLY